MPKFKTGELVILRPHARCERKLAKYQGKILQIVNFVGQIDKEPIFVSFYRVCADSDGHEFFADESVLEKLPDVGLPKVLIHRNTKPKEKLDALT